MTRTGSGRLIVLAVIWLSLLGLGAAAYKFLLAPKERAVRVDRTGSDPRHRHRITLALDSFSGYCVLRSPELQQELTARGIGLDLVDDKADYSHRMATLKSGETPLALFTIDAFLKTGAELGEFPGTIVMIIDETRGADAMIAYKTGVANVDALNRSNARFVLTPDSPSETLARVVMAHFSLPNLPANPWIAADGAADVYRRFQAAKPNEALAFVLWEPYVSKALEDPRAHVLIDSSRFRGYIVDVLVAQREFLLEHEDLVQAVIESYLRVAYQTGQRPQGMRQLVLKDSEQVGEPVSEAQAERLVAGVWWKTTQENFAHLGLLSGNSTQRLQHLEEMIRNIANVLVRTGAVRSDPIGGSANQLYYDKIFRRLQQANFHPGLIAGGAQEEGGVARPAELPTLSEEQWTRLAPVGTLQVDSIVFARGTARLTDQSRRVLDQLVETLRSWPQYYLIVRGNARRGSDPIADRQLAGERARAAAEHVVEQGIAKTRVRSVSTEPAETGGEAQTVSFILGQMPY